MIHIVVGTSHLFAILGYRRGHRFNAVLRSTLKSLVGMPILTVSTPGDLEGVTVFEVLENFHNRASELLRAAPAEIMTAQQKEIMRVARQEYHYPAFEATLDDACRSVAIHGVFPHGTLMGRTTKAFLPDFSLGVHCFGFFARSPSSVRTTMRSEEFQQWVTGPWKLEPLDQTGKIYHFRSPSAPDEMLDEDFFLELGNLLCRSQWEAWSAEEELKLVDAHARQGVDKTIENLWANRYAHDLQRLECHLCDTLLEVYGRADSYWNEIREKKGNNEVDEMFFDWQFQRDSGDEHLVIDAVVHGFQGHRSLRRDNSEVPVLGNHRLLAAKATRQGIGKPVVSGLFPISLWRLLKSPVQHFILNAAEKVGTEQYPPLYPNMPSEEDMGQLYWAAVRAEGDCGLEVEDYSDSLRKLGIEAAVRRRIAACLERLEGGEWAWDWTRAIFEYQSALYDDDIEQSLHLQDVLDLYPLHKRVLGLLEHIVVPKLQTQGNAAQRLGQAFQTQTHRTFSALRSTPNDGADTSLEMEGGWLVFAESIGPNIPVPLTGLIENLVLRINQQFAAGNVAIKCKGLTPAEHASQLAFLCLPIPEARRALQALVNIVINLRNFIEHGTDQVTGSELVITNPEFWPRLSWVMKRLHVWREQRSLHHDASGKIVPAQAANRLVLSPRSLEQSLVITALILRGCESHLNIEYT